MDEDWKAGHMVDPFKDTQSELCAAVRVERESEAKTALRKVD